MNYNLDELIAEHVFKWKWSNEKHRVADPNGWSIRNILIPPNADWMIQSYTMEPGLNSINIPIPSYSMDLNLAFKALDELQKGFINRDGYEDKITAVDISPGISKFGASMYEIRFYDQHHNTWAYSETATVSKGICYNILECLGVNLT